MKKLHLLCLAIAILSTTLHGITQPQQPKFASHLLVTILDDTEPNISRKEIDAQGGLTPELGGSASDLWAALLQESSIIIVNSSVVHYLLSYIETFKLASLKYPDAYSNLFTINKAINPIDWIKKKITNELYLLIPKKYLNSLSTYQALKSIDLSRSNYTREELALGIKLSDKMDISNKDFLNPRFHIKKESYPEDIYTAVIETDYYKKTSYYVRSWISSQLTQKIKNIFITKQEYRSIFSTKEEFQRYVPRWVVIANGHGSPYISMEERINDLRKDYNNEFTDEIERLENLMFTGQHVFLGGTIAGYNSEDFGNFVRFLEEYLCVRLLFFNTCYGGVVNIHHALHHDISPTSAPQICRPLAFPIISGTCSSALAYGSFITTGRTQIRTTEYSDGTCTTETTELPKELTNPSYKLFLDTLNASDSATNSTFMEAINHIYCPYTQNNHYSNMPVIQYGNQTWQPLIEKRTFCIIDRALAQRRNELNIMQEIPHLEIIFLETSTIPFTLLITAPKMPIIISKTPCRAHHEFTCIKAHNIDILAVANGFLGMEKLSENQTFIIKHLEAQDENGIVTTFKNVTIRNSFNDKVTEKSIFWTDQEGHRYKIENL